MFGLTRAPDLNRPGMTWFNCPRPISLGERRGRVLLLDFWTPCCVNCVQGRPTLTRVAHTLSSAVDVIGVLSPKYPWERDPEAAALAVDRLGITHPVVHDRDLVLWSQYAARAWPTLVIIDAAGMVVGHLAGEADPNRLEDGLRRLIHRGLMEGSLKPRPPPNGPPINRRGRPNPISHPGPGPRFPTGLHVGPWPGTLAVADTGNHRILVLDRTGGPRLRVGADLGFVDGPLEDARFQAPQSAFSSPDGTALYVADTGNHALRRIDLRRRRVETLAGQGWRGPPLLLGQHAQDAMLASPMDLALDGDRLYFTNAGTHQVG
ncbi:MAG: redoxin family protein, partial [Rhodospirillum sp.]|nr:redoxin family protein [Rhodospirillum sp.]